MPGIRIYHWFNPLLSHIVTAVCLFICCGATGFSQSDSTATDQILQAETARQTADYDQAADQFRKAIELAGMSGHISSYVTALNGLALTFLENSQFDLALFRLEQAAGIIGQSGNVHDSISAVTAHLRGRYHLTLDRFAEARIHLEKAFALREKLSNFQQAESVSYLGFLAIREGDFADAERLLNQAKTTYAQSTHPRAPEFIGRTHTFLGILNHEKRDWSQAISHYEEAVDLFKQSLGEAHPKLAMAYVRLGLCYQITRDQPEAFRLYQQALSIQQKKLPATHLDRVLTYSYLGIYWGNQGDHGQALTYFQQALRIVRLKMGEKHRLVASMSNNAGNALLSLKRYDEAEAHIRRAVRIFEEVFGPDHLRVAAVYYSLGLSHWNQGEIQEAINSYWKTLEIRKRRQGANHVSLAEVYNNLGMCFKRQGDCQTALNYFQQAVQIGLDKKPWFNGSVARYHNNVANCFRNQSQYAEALSWHQQAIAHLIPEFSPASPSQNPTLKNVYSNQTLLEVLTAKALTLTQKADIDSMDVSGYHAALETYLLSAQLIDTMRKAFLHDESKYKLAAASLPVYEGGIRNAYHLYTLTGDRQYLEVAFQMSEKNKAILLLQSLKSTSAYWLADMPPEIIEQEQYFANRISALQSKIFSASRNATRKDSLNISSWEQEVFRLTLSADSLSETIKTQYPAYYQLAYDLGVASVSDIQQSFLDSTEALVTYFVGKKVLAIFYINSHVTDWTILPKDSLFVPTIEDFRHHLLGPFMAPSGRDAQMPSSAGYQETAKALYDQLIGPLYALIPNPAFNLTIIPDAELGYLPFDALISHLPDQDEQYKSYPYLIHDHQISYAYSASTLAEMNTSGMSQTPVRDRAIAFAPDFGGQEMELVAYNANRSEFGPLAFNRQEVEGIAELINCDVFTGKKATESTFQKQAGQYRIIHLSTHAKVNDEDPLYSRIAFAQSTETETDGFLTVAELFNMHLPADLVVLSACETGIGKLFRGEGVVSQARGFAYAGAKSMVTTLWSVNDAATSEIMLHFYRHLKAGIAKDAALRQARLDYMESSDNLSAHPFYWAGYVPVGNMNPIDFPSAGFPFSILWVIAVLLLVIGGFILVRLK